MRHFDYLCVGRFRVDVRFVDVEGEDGGHGDELGRGDAGASHEDDEEDGTGAAFAGDGLGDFHLVLASLEYTS